MTNLTHQRFGRESPGLWLLQLGRGVGKGLCSLPGELGRAWVLQESRRCPRDIFGWLCKRSSVTNFRFWRAVGTGDEIRGNLGISGGDGPCKSYQVTVHKPPPLLGLCSPICSKRHVDQGTSRGFLVILKTGVWLCVGSIGAVFGFNHVSEVLPRPGQPPWSPADDAWERGRCPLGTDSLNHS